MSKVTRLSKILIGPLHAYVNIKDPSLTPIKNATLLSTFGWVIIALSLSHVTHFTSHLSYNVMQKDSFNILD